MKDIDIMGQETRSRRPVVLLCHTLFVLYVAVSVATSANIGEMGGLWLLFMWIDFPFSLLVLLVWIGTAIGLESLQLSAELFHQVLNACLAMFFGVAGGLQCYWFGWPGKAVAPAAKWMYQTIKGHLSNPD